jgi:hypothetical protein
MPQTPLSSDAKLVVEESNTDGVLRAVLNDDGNASVIALSIPSPIPGQQQLLFDQFKWLVSSAAELHGIEFVDQTDIGEMG